MAPSTPTLRSKVGVRLIYLHIPAPVGAPPWTPRGLPQLMGREWRRVPVGLAGSAALPIADGDALRPTAITPTRPAAGDGAMEEWNRSHR